MFLWIWQSARLESRFWLIELRSHVLMRRKTLKDRFTEATEGGKVSKYRRSVLISGKSETCE